MKTVSTALPKAKDANWVTRYMFGNSLQKEARSKIMTITAKSDAAWRFWGGWGLAFIGFPLGGLAATALVGGVSTPLEGLVGGLASGAVIGLIQWLALRRRLALTPWWIAATAAGMGVGLALGIALLGIDTGGNTLPLRGLVTGAGIGIAQFVLLRGGTARALIWPLVVAGGWAIGWLVTRAAGIDLALQWAVFGSSGALTFQLLTGLALAWLLPQAAAERNQQAASFL
jgi:hypothetical protein